jgi:hypothetical protein
MKSSRVNYLQTLINNIPRDLVKIIIVYVDGWQDITFTRLDPTHLKLFSDYRGMLSGYQSIHVTQQETATTQWRLYLFTPRIILIWNKYGKVIREIGLPKDKYVSFCATGSYFALLNPKTHMIDIFDSSTFLQVYEIFNASITKISKLHSIRGSTDCLQLAIDTSLIIYNILRAPLRGGIFRNINLSPYSALGTCINDCKDGNKLIIASRRHRSLIKLEPQANYANYVVMNRVDISDYWYTGKFDVDFKTEEIFVIQRDDGDREVIQVYDRNLRHKEQWGNKLYFNPIGGCAVCYDHEDDSVWVFNSYLGVVTRNLRTH